jgi:hypothetical protein
VHKYTANPRPSAGMTRIRFKGFIAAGFIPKRRLSSFTEHPSVNSEHYVIEGLSMCTAKFEEWSLLKALLKYGQYQHIIAPN